MTPGEYLRSVRESYDLGVQEFAGVCGLPTGTISGYENGTVTNPKISMVMRLAEAYRVDPWDLAGRYVELASSFALHEDHRPISTTERTAP